MKRRIHIAYIAFPHRSHINPSIPVVSALVRRGHRVTYAASHQYATKIEVAGAEFVPCPDLISDIIAKNASEKAGKIQVFSESMCQLAMRTLAKLTCFYDENKPDLIIYDFVSLAGRILVKRWNIPAIQVSSHFAYDELSITKQIRDIGLRTLNIDLAKQADVFFERYGIDDRNFLFHREKLNIHLFPRDFDPSGATDERCFYAGRCPGEQTYLGNWHRENRLNKPLALVATSTTYARGGDYFRMCVDALVRLKWHVILLIGDNAEPSSFLPLPPNFQLIQKVSPTEILPHTSLLISGGGMITTAEAVYHGVPSVMTSWGSRELEGLAEIFADLGAGIHIKKSDMSAESLRQAAVDTYENAALLDRLRQLQYRAQRAPGAEETANRIEEYIEAHCIP